MINQLQSLQKLESLAKQAAEALQKASSENRALREKLQRLDGEHRRMKEELREAKMTLARHERLRNRLQKLSEKLEKVS